MGRQYDKFEVKACDVHPWDLLMMGTHPDGRPKLISVKKVDVTVYPLDLVLVEISGVIVGNEIETTITLKPDANELLIKVVPTIGD